MKGFESGFKAWPDTKLRVRVASANTVFYLEREARSTQSVLPKSGKMSSPAMPCISKLHCFEYCSDASAYVRMDRPSPRLFGRSPRRPRGFQRASMGSRLPCVQSRIYPQ